MAGTGTGSYSGDNGAATSAALNGPCGISIDSSGNIYIADYNNHRVRKVTVSTGIITTVAGTGTAGYNGDNIAATSATLCYPHGVTVDSYGNLYIADRYNHRIRKVTVSTGEIATIAGTGTASSSGDGSAATSATINAPTYCQLDSVDNLYISEFNDNNSGNRVRKVFTVTTDIPTVEPSNAPTRAPTSQPTSQPSAQPSQNPSSQPSSRPSSQPSSQPSARPSSQPSSQVTIHCYLSIRMP